MWKDTQVRADRWVLKWGGPLWALCSCVYELQWVAPAPPPAAAARSHGQELPHPESPDPLGPSFNVVIGAQSHQQYFRKLKGDRTSPHDRSAQTKWNVISLLLAGIPSAQSGCAAYLGLIRSPDGPYMHPWQIKMNDYLINAIGLARTAFQSMAPWSSKAPNERGSQRHRGRDLPALPGPALAGAPFPGYRKWCLWDPWQASLSQNLTRFKVLLQMPTDAEHWAFISPEENVRSQGAGVVAGLQTTSLTPISSSLKKAQWNLVCCPPRNVTRDLGQ